MPKKCAKIILICFMGIFISTNVLAGFSEIMSSTNYKVSPDSINAGGGDSQSSTNYKVKDTVGEIATGTSEASSYTLKAGYRQTSDAIDSCGNGICDAGESVANCPVDCSVATATADTGGPGPKPDKKAPEIINLFISKIAIDSEKIIWETNEQALCKFYLGKNTSYEIGISEEPTFYYQHLRQLVGLEAGQVYHFKLVCRDTNYNSAETSDLSFTFQEGVSLKTIPNVQNLSSSADEKTIKLKWLNPDFPEFGGVVVVKNENFFPNSPSDGETIYRGEGYVIEDKNVKTGKRYYYTVFVYNNAGDYSSGATITDVPRIPGTPQPPLTIIPSPTPPGPEIAELTIRDFDFFLGNKRIFPSSSGEIYTEPGKPLTVFLKYGKVPETLKTILVNLRSGDKFFSFILRVNKDKTGYEATMMSPLDVGVYPVAIDIMDYQNQTLKKVFGEINVQANVYSVVKGKKQVMPYLYVLVGAGLVLIPVLIVKRRKKKAEGQKSQIPMTNDQSNTKIENTNDQNVNLPEELKTPQLSEPKMRDAEGRERKDFPRFKL